MPTIQDYRDKQAYIKRANEVEEKYNIPNNILVGILGAESAFNKDIITGRRKSSAGAIGIAQFMPATAKQYGIDPTDPMQSIEAAGKYLNSSFKKLGNWDDTIRSYNMGLGGVQKWKAGKRSLPKETKEYLGRVYKHSGMDYKEKGEHNNNSYTSQEKQFNYDVKYPTTTAFKDLEIPDNSTTFAEDKELEKVKKETQEYNFLQEFNKLYQTPKQEEVITVQEPSQEVPTQNLQDIYSQVSQFIDTPIAQQGGNIGNLDSVQTEDVEKQRMWLNNWNNNREIAGKKVNSNTEVPYSSDIYIDDLNYGNPSSTTLGEFDHVNNRIIFDTNYTSKPGIPSHEFTHRFEKDYRAKDSKGYDDYISLPINKYLSKKDGLNSYNSDPDETHAEINRLRYNQGYLPNQVITKEDVEKADLGKYNFNQFNKDEVLDMLNSTASIQDKSKSFISQQGGIILDQQGQRNHPNKITKILGDTMATDGYGGITLYTVPDIGLPKIIKANSGEHTFKNATSFTEYPITKDEEKFLKYISKIR